MALNFWIYFLCNIKRIRMKKYHLLLILGVSLLLSQAALATSIPYIPKITPRDKIKIVFKIDSVKSDYPAHHQGFRESLIQDILELTEGNFIDTIGYYVYKMLPDIKE